MYIDVSSFDISLNATLSMSYAEINLYKIPVVVGGIPVLKRLILSVLIPVLSCGENITFVCMFVIENISFASTIEGFVDLACITA